MDTTQPGLFRLADARLAWLDRRQTLLAQNIANADTPGYRPRDLVPFAASLDIANVTLARTDPLDLPGPRDALAGSLTVRPQEVAPDGNAVSMEDELSKVAGTQTAQELTVNLYTSWLGMFRTVLDRGS